MKREDAHKKQTKKRRAGNRQPTLADLAAAAGVSIATVSLALNGSPLVAEKTVKRVMKAAIEHNYRPHAIARRLSTGRSEVISLFMVTGREDSSGWILPSSWMFYNPILKGVSLTLSRSNYQLQFEVLTVDEAVRKNAIMKPVLERATDGILILVHDEYDYSFMSELEGIDIPVAILNRKLFPNVSSVQVNNYQGAYDAVNYLIRLGHRRIAHIAGPANSYNAQDRRKGYVQAMTTAGIDLKADFVLEGDWRIESGYHLMRQLLTLSSPPTAVFCSNDHMAIGALRAINESGLAVPQDISLIGFDDSEISRVVSPALTTVKQPLEELGRRAAEILLNQHKASKEVQHIVIPPQLVERESCSLR